MALANTRQSSAAPREPNLLTELRSRHTHWYYWTLVYTGLAVLCLVASMIDERGFQGVSVWHKPFKFALSIAVYFATLGWFANLMPNNYFSTIRGKVLTALPIICALFEMLYILIQGARGEASHFNQSSVFYATMYGLMGLGALLMVVTCLWMGSSILRHRDTRDIWVLSVGIGLLATFVLGGGFGSYLSSSGNHWVGGEATDAGGVPLFNWSRTGGDLRVAHFFGIHAMQIIPLTGAMLDWLVQRNHLGRAGARICLIGASIAFALFTTSTFVQAVGGAPLF